ncbi:PTS transporter subunit EIIC [Paenibacillus sp. UNC499MF]|uniref:PTS transporter subunit EIIC n=1 Tax=Paenibacillus sp. UNC499MF TaxID=1502751 RepID=UPI0008A055D0|nr:PTS transporter subunit EIIC [Paenibacillus sp. UNC499MF]SEG74388.1 PTS system, N-acetylglucosamine-specific IIC component [Paenibacillus sp. UNC499MF]
MLHTLQKVGRSLMIPIAVLPAAAILQRLGAFTFEDPFLIFISKIFSAGGQAIVDNLPLLFAIGIAIGMTSGQGVAALAATVGYVVFVRALAIFESVPAEQSIPGAHLDMGVLGGMMTGLITVMLFNRFHNIKLPDYLMFFGGRRFVPIITSLVMVVMGGIMGLIWPPVQEVIRDAGLWIVDAGGIGVFMYGFLNRLLLVTGLHHILNSIVWFQVGEFMTAPGTYVHGDMTRYNAGDPSAGMFMSGFFPTMIFGLPAAALAMIKCALPEKRNKAAALLYSAALTSMLTGVTEPLEFSFMFAAPLLYGVHAVLNGLAMLLMHLFNIKLGFSFSGGIIDLLLNWKLKEFPFMFLIIGAVYFVVYYGLFLFLIKAFKLKTPGREEDFPGLAAAIVSSAPPPEEERITAIVNSVGGIDNIIKVDSCITRLRLWLKEAEHVEEEKLKELGAFGIMNMGKGHVHVIFGTDSELIKESIAKRLAA